ncbi:hypothetical protein HHO41_19385 [Bacillus sp. DNRA2]|uniref:hypothetical protein n=1 Tax=Bacillus sp. DNRA2 TaxID=2723053 RepID=UPI00145D967A|nr:hypothetical protein [Bacillus sp. DNRA2]NMD72437.1 hypothetical protein [Bacillus sp. DNRA2]
MNIELVTLGDLKEFKREHADSYVTTYSLTIAFVDRRTSEDEEAIGLLVIYFDVKGYGIEGTKDDDQDIDVSYQIPFFVNQDNKEEMLEDDEAFIYVFTHWGKMIRGFVEVAWEVLDEHFEYGTPRVTLFEDNDEDYYSEEDDDE